MRRVIVTALCAAAFLFMRPEPAHAWFDWIDQLSGPGPFAGIDFQWRLVCVKDPNVANATTTDQLKATDLRSLDNFEGGAKVLAGIFGAGCVPPKQHDVHPIGSLNFRIARYWSTSNHLEYAPGVAAPAVNLWQYETSYSTFVDGAKTFEITMGMGASVFSGDGFDSMTRAYFRPVMLTFTPGGRLARTSGTPGKGSAGRSLARAMSLSTGIVYMPKGFNAANFGAVGTYKTDHELLLTAAVSLDLSRF